MTIEYINDLIKEFEDSNNVLHGFYIGYKHSGNSTAQKWGKMDELAAALKSAAESDMCVQGELPIERLIIYASSQCFAFVKNPLHDVVNDESEDSHTLVVVPYIASDGWFGRIISERVVFDLAK